MRIALATPHYREWAPRKSACRTTNFAPAPAHPSHHAAPHATTTDMPSAANAATIKRRDARMRNGARRRQVPCNSVSRSILCQRLAKTAEQKKTAIRPPFLSRTHWTAWKAHIYRMERRAIANIKDGCRKGASVFAALELTLRLYSRLLIPGPKYFRLRLSASAPRLL